MGTDAGRVQLSSEDVQRKAAFQEVPGEAEADAVRQDFLQRAAAPGQLGPGLAGIAPSMRAQVIERLQRERGNAFVQRVVASSRGEEGSMVGLSQGDMVSEVQRRKGSGSPLPSETRSQMEGYFGADLGGVRVHADGEAASLSRELNAHAFTTGKDVFFGEGKYNPGSSDGMATLAHELTHVGQQGGFGAPVQRNAEELQALSIQREEGAESEDEELQALAIQREEGPESEDEELQALSVQREEGAEAEDEELQALSVQREGEEDEIQAMSVQREGEEDELQALSVQREGEEDELQMMAVQREEGAESEDEELQALAIQRQPSADEEERTA